MRVFVDGKEETTSSPCFPLGGGVPDTFNGSVSLGLDVPNAPLWLLRGLVDDVTLYNRALAASEIRLIASAGSAGKGLSPASQAIGGTGTGVMPMSVLCHNVTTGQREVILDGRAAWNCEAAGLVALPGDVTEQTVTGRAD